MKRRGATKTVLALLSLFLVSFCLPSTASAASKEEALAQLDEADRAYCEYDPFGCARRVWPDELANVWGVGQFPGTGPGSEMHFAFTSGAEEKVAFLRELFPGHESIFIPHTFEYSEKYLLALQRRIEEDFKKLRSGELQAPHDSFEFGWIGLFGGENRIRIPMLPFPPAFEAWALERWGPAVILEATPGLIPWPGTEMPGRTYPYVPETETPDGGSPESGKEPSGPKATSARLKADRRLVRRCRKSSKSRSAERRRFSKSKKCKRARRAVITARA